MSTPPDPDWEALGAPPGPEERAAWVKAQLPSAEELYNPQKVAVWQRILGQLIIALSGFEIGRGVVDLQDGKIGAGWFGIGVWTLILALNVATTIRLDRSILRLYRSGLSLMASMAAYAVDREAKRGG